MSSLPQRPSKRLRQHEADDDTDLHDPSQERGVGEGASQDGEMMDDDDKSGKQPSAGRLVPESSHLGAAGRRHTPGVASTGLPS
jgi:hypothetical protein